MLIYRVEHHETGSGPFQSEFYPKGLCRGDFCPHKWGDYLPVYDEAHDNHYDYRQNMRRWGCHDKHDIKVINPSEAEALEKAGWIIRIYEVPVNAVFTCDSGKQVIFDFSVAVIVSSLNLVSFIHGEEVEYVPA